MHVSMTSMTAPFVQSIGQGLGAPMVRAPLVRVISGWPWPKRLQLNRNQDPLSPLALPHGPAG